MGKSWKRFFVGSAIIFSSLMEGYGAGVTRKYAWEDLREEDQAKVKERFDGDGFKSQFIEESSYVREFGAKKAGQELKCTGVCKIEVAAAPLEFAIDEGVPNIVELDNQGRLVCKEGLLAKITAPFSTLAKITVNRIVSRFEDGDYHFLKIKRVGGEQAIFLHKKKTTGQIVVDPAGVNVFCLLSSKKCEARDDDSENGGCCPIPPNDDLGEHFDIKTKDNVDFGATFNISIEAAG